MGGKFFVFIPCLATRMFIDQQLLAKGLPDAATVLRDWKARWPDLGVLMLLPEAEKQNIGTLQEAARNLSVPICGAVFPALVTDGGFCSEGAWFLCIEHMPPHFLADIGNGTVGTDTVTSAIRSVWSTQATPDAPAPTVFLVFDSMLPQVGTLLDQLHSEFDDTLLYAGVNAGSETFQPMPCLFDENRHIGNGVLGLFVAPQTQVVVRHGYPVSKRLMAATSTHGNRIDTIDGRPALEVYQSVIKEEYDVTLTRENFYDHAVHFPFGVITALDVLVRIPVALNDDGSLICVGEIPPSTMLRLLRAPALENSNCVAEIVDLLNPTSQTWSEKRPLLTFYCAGRRMHFGDQAAQELKELKTSTQSSLLMGALSLGEIDSLEDFKLPRFHNAALVCIPHRKRQ